MTRPPQAMEGENGHADRPISAIYSAEVLHRFVYRVFHRRGRRQVIGGAPGDDTCSVTLAAEPGRRWTRGRRGQG